MAFFLSKSAITITKIHKTIFTMKISRPTGAYEPQLGKFTLRMNWLNYEWLILD